MLAEGCVDEADVGEDLAGVGDLGEEFEALLKVLLVVSGEGSGPGLELSLERHDARRMMGRRMREGGSETSGGGREDAMAVGSLGCGREWRAGRREREGVRKGRERKERRRRKETGETKATRGVGEKEQGENKSKRLCRAAFANVPEPSFPSS